MRRLYARIAFGVILAVLPGRIAVTVLVPRIAALFQEETTPAGNLCRLARTVHADTRTITLPHRDALRLYQDFVPELTVNDILRVVPIKRMLFSVNAPATALNSLYQTFFRL